MSRARWSATRSWPATTLPRARPTSGAASGSSPKSAADPEASQAAQAEASLDVRSDDIYDDYGDSALN